MYLRTYIQTYKETYKQTYTQTDIHANIQTCMHTITYHSMPYLAIIQTIPYLFLVGSYAAKSPVCSCRWSSIWSLGTISPQIWQGAPALQPSAWWLAKASARQGWSKGVSIWKIQRGTPIILEHQTKTTKLFKHWLHPLATKQSKHFFLLKRLAAF